MINESKTRVPAAALSRRVLDGQSGVLNSPANGQARRSGCSCLAKIRGDFGEVAVCNYILEQGYEIVANNYRKRFGEIDIIAVHRGEIVFIEVKTRKFGSLIKGIEAVTLTKRRTIAKTARTFLDENPQFHNMNTRFDVAQVVVTTEEIPQVLEIDYCQNAFEPMLM